MERRVLTECDNHRAQGGPHLSRALVVGPYFDHRATVVMCTALLGRVTRQNRRVCGNEYLILEGAQDAR
jgi:hypothetical protein